MRLKLHSSRGSILLILTLITAFLIRMYRLEERVGFGADQEYLFYKAKELLSGDPVLLGMATSVGGFSIGPFFTYLWTLFSFLFSGNPLSGSYLSVFLGLITVVVIFFTTRVVFKSYLTALSLAIIYSFSYSIYVWDISPWPPSLFYISQFFLIAGIYISTKRSSGFMLAALGFAIGFNSHISIFVSLFPAMVFWFVNYRNIKKKINTRHAYYSLAIIFLAVLPNLIFDLSHQFINIKRLFGLVGNPQTQYFHPSSLSKITYSLYESSIGVLYPSAEKNSLPFIFWGVIALVLLTLRNSKLKSFVYLLLLWLFIPAVVFLSWKGNFSEYYLTMITVPAFILLLGCLIKHFSKRWKIITLWLFILFSFVNLKAWKDRTRPLNLSAMKNAVNLIIEMGGKSEYGVSLSTMPGYQFGYEYLFDYYNATPDIPPKKGETKIFTIVIPPGYEGINARVEYDGIGVLWEGVGEI